MTARDDYPALSDLVDDLELFRTDRDRQQVTQDVKSVLSEIDRLRQWKAEAQEVIARWDRCHDLIPPSAQTLGALKSESVFQYLLARARVGNPAGLRREPNS